MARIPDFLYDYAKQLPESSKRRIFLTYFDGGIQKYSEVIANYGFHGLQWFYMAPTKGRIHKNLPLYAPYAMFPPYLKGTLKELREWKSCTKFSPRELATTIVQMRFEERMKNKLALEAAFRDALLSLPSEPKTVHVQNIFLAPNSNTRGLGALGSLGSRALGPLGSLDLDNPYRGFELRANSIFHSKIMLEHRKETLRIQTEMALRFKKKTTLKEYILNQLLIAICLYSIDKILKFIKPFVLLFLQRISLLVQIRFQIFKQKMLEIKHKILLKIETDFKKQAL